MLNRKEINLKDFSHIKIGPPSNVWVASNAIELLENPGFIIDKTILGNCSKLLLPEELENAFLNIDEEPVIENSEGILHVSSGVRLKDLVHYCIDNGLSGFDFMTGIPGTVGGLIWMNGGSFGKHVWTQVEKARVISSDGRVLWLEPKDVKAEYRNSHLNQIGVKFVVDVYFYYEHEDKDDIKNEVVRKIEYRKKRHPVEYPSLGSTFKNPDGQRSWQLLTEVGLSGYRIGDSMFSTKHANFIINLGNATRTDVLSLIELAQARVLKRFGIHLEPEIVIL
jgi:UDP-N-acetylmuramate dehydrogenase